MKILRIGQIVPSSNVTMETEIPAMLNAHGARHGIAYTFHSSRMRMHNVTREELVAMNREGLRCIAELTDAEVDIASTACLVAHMAMGPGYHRTAQAGAHIVVWSTSIKLMPQPGRDPPGVGIKNDLVPVKAVPSPMQIMRAIKAIGIMNSWLQSSHIDMPAMIGPMPHRM